LVLICRACGYEEQPDKLRCTLCGTLLENPKGTLERSNSHVSGNGLPIHPVETSPADLYLTLHIGEIKLIMPFPVGFELKLGRGADVKTVTLVEPVHNVYPKQGGELHFLEYALNFLNLVPFGAEKAGVSRKHALICRTDAGFEIEDLGSTNGTRVNSERLHSGQRHKVRSGDIITLGLLSVKLVSIHDHREIHEAQYRKNAERNKPAS